MPIGYSEEIKKAVSQAPKSIGNQLGRWAVHLGFSVSRISKTTGATRQTVYYWLTGGQVSPAYRDRVKALLEILRASTSAEMAWRKACLKFPIKQ